MTLQKKESNIALTRFDPISLQSRSREFLLPVEKWCNEDENILPPGIPRYPRKCIRGCPSIYENRWTIRDWSRGDRGRMSKSARSLSRLRWRLGHWSPSLRKIIPLWKNIFTVGVPESLHFARTVESLVVALFSFICVFSRSSESDYLMREKALLEEFFFLATRG